jgi:hypothetical protein
MPKLVAWRLVAGVLRNSCPSTGTGEAEKASMTPRSSFAVGLDIP